jgi:hypothetical protein
MYATAHRVLSARNGREGVNAFLHIHGAGFPWPINAALLPEIHPGRLEDEIIGVKPGGNRVRAYLDVLAPDPFPAKLLFQVLNQLLQKLPDLDTPLVYTHSGVTIRFGVETGLLARKTEEFQELMDTLRLLLDPQRATSQ